MFHQMQNRHRLIPQIVPLHAALWLLIIVLIPGVAVCADKKLSHETVFEKLKSSFLHLRNTDAEISRLGEWKDLAAKFEAYAQAHKTGEHAPRALYNASILWQKIYQRFGKEEALIKSRDLTKLLVKSYQKNSLSDDALLLEADLLTEAGEREAAEKICRRIIEEYPDSDTRPIAEARLQPARKNFGTEGAARIAPVHDVKSGRVALVVLDPGHGGEDWGASGPGGLLEKDVTLAVAFELEKVLTQNPDVSVVLTRRQDLFLPLPDRIALSNKLNADLFVSLHTNASPSRRLSGLQTFYLDSQGDEATRLLVDRENNAGQTQGAGLDDLQFMLGDLLQNAKVEESIVLAHMVQDGLLAYLNPKFSNIRDLGVRKAPFYVLVGAHMPCILTEMFFIDNAEDGSRLGTREFRQAVAGGIANGIKSFLLKQGLLTGGKLKGVKG